MKSQYFGYSIAVCQIMLISTLAIACTSIARAATANYTLENILTNEGDPFTGAFQWEYTEGDFENGIGTFTELILPGHGSNINELNITFDIGSSIEFSLAANLHNEGVDVTLFLVDSLTPTSGADIDTDRSKWGLGGGFNGSPTSGTYVSGHIAPVSVSAVPLPAAVWFFGSGVLSLIGVYRAKSNTQYPRYTRLI